jgi:hypothetical protein
MYQTPVQHNRGPVVNKTIDSSSDDERLPESEEEVFDVAVEDI